MIVDGTDFLNNPPTKTQVCIVGSGQAGITLAWYLVRQGIDVTILEGSRVTNPAGPNAPYSSSAYPYNENINLYNGQNEGLFAQNENEFLIRPSVGNSDSGRGWERERIYGGTSTHWGGQSRPLDPIVFEERPGFPGWPIKREDLDPYYEEACDFLGLYGDYYGPDGQAGYNFTAEFWANELGYAVADMEGFNVDMYQFVPSQNLQFQARQVDGKTIGESAARVITNASLLKIENQNGGVTELTVGVLGGTQSDPTFEGEFKISADIYVLACGAVANARQLLLSDVGNESGLVGCYFTGQPIATNGNVHAVSTSPDYLTQQEQDLIRYQSVFGYPISAIKGVLTPTAEAATRLQTGRCWFSPDGSGNYYHGLLPEISSRISLCDPSNPDNLDVFHQPKTKATWVLSDEEERSYNELTQLFKTAVEAKGGGEVTIAPWNEVKDAMVYNGHHLGTTRMSDNPEDGVVDKNLKVHSMDNLYVAGSSIWVQAGLSNPTFSIVTFSIRLAEHIGQQLNGSSSILKRNK